MSRFVLILLAEVDLKLQERSGDSVLEILRCPTCQSRLQSRGLASQAGAPLEALECQQGAHRYPIVDGIPRFVPQENYATSFGFEWELYGDLQNDRIHDHSITSERFFRQLGCRPEDLDGLRVLEVGCGGGRFSDVVLRAGGELYAVDLSRAVEKNVELNAGHAGLHPFQASIFELPFAPESFDVVFCFGVLQHTPDPRAAFDALVPFVKPGGRMAVDIYAAHPKQTSHWKYLVRPVTKRMDPERVHHWIQRLAPKLVPLSRQIRRIPKLGKPLSRLVPIFVHDGFMGKVSPEEEVRWAILETLDALTPAYDRPRSRRTLQRWFEKAGMERVETACVMNALNHGNARKPLRAGAGS